MARYRAASAFFCFLLLLLCTGRAAAAQPAAGGSPISPAHAREASFFLLDTGSLREKTEAQAVIGEFFSKPPLRRYDPFLGALELISFTADNESRYPEGRPDMRLTLRNGSVFLQTGADEKLLVAEAVINKPTPEWPLAVILAGDIDFDGGLEFFALTTPAASGSFGFTLLDGGKRNAKGLPLFAPFPESAWSLLPEGYHMRALFPGEAPNPHFVPEKGRLEFISKLGPFYDTERWCFADGQYFLCEKITQSYYAHADNMYEIARHVRFTRQGEVESIVCRALDDADEARDLLFAAGAAVPLYDEPGDEASRTTVLEPGAVVRVQDYFMVEDAISPAIWYKVERAGAPGQTGWCCVDVGYPLVRDGRLYLGDLEPAGLYVGDSEHGYTVLGVRRTATGAELLVSADGRRFILPNAPIMTPLRLESSSAPGL